MILIILCLICSLFLYDASNDIQDASISFEIVDGFKSNLQENPYGDYSCIILHKFHNLTDFAKGQIDLAFKEIKDDKQCFYVVLYWIDQFIYSTKQNNDILWLKTNNNNLNKYNYFIVDIPKTQHTFPDLFDFMDRNNYEWLRRDTWPWQMADIPEMVWYETFESMLDINNLKIWMLEYDVGWKGNLPKLYHALEYEYNDKHSIDCDIMAYDCIDKKPKWSHYYKHTDLYKYNEMEISLKPEPISCLIQMLRYNPKLLRMMIDEINANKIVYCEMRAAMICQRNNDWCKICDLYRPRNKYFGTFYSGTSFDSKAWRDILNNHTIPISFWHRINTLWTH